MQLEELDALPLGLSISIGFLATAILVVNNVRDLETDRRAGKMTLAVRMGRAQRGRALPAARARRLRRCCRSRWSPATRALLPLIGLLALPLAIGPMRAMTNRTDGPALNGALAAHRRRCSASSACWSRAGLLISA